MVILDVDLLAFERGSSGRRAAVVDGVMRSLTTGFVYIKHDLGNDFLDEVYERLQTFFRLSQESKERYTVPGAHGETGYTGFLTETAATADYPDYKEMLNWGKELPVGHPLREFYPFRFGPPVLPEYDLPGITELLCDFHSRVLELQKRVLQIIGTGLGVHEDYFRVMMDPGATLTRAIHYPAISTAPSLDHVWAAEHGDINLITALPRATNTGLQVRTDDGWVNVAPPDDNAIINTGMMLEHLTNGLIPTGIHRVIATENQPGDRHSVVQFAHPTPWTILSPLPTCITAENPLRYPAIAASDALAKVVWEINLVEGGRRVEEPSRSRDLGEVEEPSRSRDLGEVEEPSRSRDLGEVEEPSRSRDLGEVEEPSRSRDLGEVEEPSRSRDLGEVEEPSRSRDLGEDEDVEASGSEI